MALGFLKHLWDLFSGLFVSLEHATKKVYDALPKADQDALIHGSGFLAVVNTMLDAAPEEVETSLQNHFPDIEVKSLETKVYDLCKSLGLTSDGSFHDSIVKLQGYLKNLANGNIWSGITTGLSLALALLFGDASAKASVYSQLIGYVYKFIVRPKVMSTEVPTVAQITPTS